MDNNIPFALALYRNLMGDSTANFLYSPYSILEALGLADMGARGATDLQIRDVLKTNVSQADLASAMLTLRTDLLARGNHTATPMSEDPVFDDIRMLKRPTPARSLKIANALWAEQTIQLESHYLDQIETCFNGGLHTVNFIEAPDRSRQMINEWVAQQTERQIKDLLSPKDINILTRLVLVNAIYFKNAWARRPDPALTRDDTFTLLESTQATVQVPMMHMGVAKLDYFKGDSYQAIEIPYAEKFGSMLIILPDSGQFVAVERRLDYALFDTIASSLSKESIRLTMPCFTFDYSLDLADTLRVLGITNMFDPRLADFSGMWLKPLYVSKVIHKAFIGVDEEGTVAAGISALTIPIGSARPSPFIQLDVNRPFIFAIRDSQTGMILFMGRVLNPIG